MTTKIKILIIDDDPNICQLLNLYLQRENYTVFLAHDGSTGLKMLREIKPDLLLLDLMLPNISGWELCKLIREESNIPIIMLTAKDSSEDKVKGLDLGADDYVVKPFDPNEVLARVRARLRQNVNHSNNPAEQETILGDLVVNMYKYEVIFQGKKISLTPKEIQLLNYFIANQGIVVSREQILEKVWGYAYAGETRTVDMHVRNLREKFSGSNHWQIKTVYGVGYKLEVINV
ncbi:response regulator transcription factor [Bacillota bacterium LX-D]|nr:response regulator transcription factor [Bacillota bacterium LX-D]